MQYKPPITINEAKKILGKDSGELSDEQIMEIVECLRQMAKKYLSGSGSKKSLGV